MNPELINFWLIKDGFDASEVDHRHVEPFTWRFPCDVHHLDVGTHLQQRLQELVGLAVEGAREHFRAASIPGRQFGHMKRRQRGELSAHLLSLGEKPCHRQNLQLDATWCRFKPIRIRHVYLQSVVFVLQVFDAESLSFNLLSQQRGVDHLDT